MGQGDKRKKSDVVIVSTKSVGKEGGGSGVQGNERLQCPTSFQVKLDKKYLKYINTPITTRLENGLVVIVIYDKEEIIKGRRGVQIARCIKENHYKYEGLVVLQRDNIYAQLRIT